MLHDAPVFNANAAGVGIADPSVMRGTPWNVRNLPNGTQCKQFAALELGAAPYDWVAGGSDLTMFTPLMDVRGYSHLYGMIHTHTIAATSLSVRINYSFLAPMPVHDTVAGLTQLGQRVLYSSTCLPAGGVSGATDVNGRTFWMNIKPAGSGPLVFPTWAIYLELVFSNNVAVTAYEFWLSLFCFTNLPFAQ